MVDQPATPTYHKDMPAAASLSELPENESLSELPQDDKYQHGYSRFNDSTRGGFVGGLASRQYGGDIALGIAGRGRRRSSVAPFDMMEFRASMDASKANAQAEYCVLDQTAAAESFLASIRVPASFLAAASFSEMFDNDVEHNNSSIQLNLQAACLICQGLTFVLATNVIILSSSSLVRVLTADFDPFAENPYEMLFREFHFEFVSIRWSFLVSLYGFLVAVTLKTLYQFELFNIYADNYERYRLELGIAVVLLMSALYMQLSAYVNSTLIGWNGIMDMTIDMLKMLLKRGSERKTWREPTSLVVAIAGLAFLILAFIPGAQI
mmetsp:Transcript_15597/g.29029  ORF Transcript_15597/g.29029 Transcript_15597/m.29029 type:complete len:323 (+) Transcript_15597:75-1043(+)